MNKYRNTYAVINLENIEKNVRTIIENRPDYEYYIGIVKADSYGHNGPECIQAFIDGGCNFLGVSSLEEALNIRENFKEIPILCIEPIVSDYLNLCVENNISITISSLDYLKKVIKTHSKGLKIHIKLDTGMNRLGFKAEEEFLEAMNLIQENDLYVEGIYTHIYSAHDKERTEKQFSKYEEFLNLIDYHKIPMRHVANSETIYEYPKLSIANGIRMGMGVFGMTPTDKMPVESTFSLHSEIIEIRRVQKGEDVGYSNTFIAEEDCLIATVPIGYVDGLTRANKGRNVYIHDRPYKIVGNICMDMMMLLVDEKVAVGDSVDLIRDRFDLYEIADYTNSCTEEVICLIGKRVPRIYVKGNEND